MKIEVVTTMPERPGRDAPPNPLSPVIADLERTGGIRKLSGFATTDAEGNEWDERKYVILCLRRGVREIGKAITIRQHGGDLWVELREPVTRPRKPTPAVD